MTIQPLKNDQSVVNMANNVSQPANSVVSTQSVDQQKSAQLESQKKSSALHRPDLTNKSDTSSMLRFQSLQEKSDTDTVKAQAVRIASDVGQELENIKVSLSTVIKDYPPFPEGSEKRVEYLMGISSIRDQIEGMTIPPKNVKGDNSKIWDDMFKLVDLSALLPSGPAEANASEINNALSMVTAMQKGLVERRSALEQQVSSAGPVTAQIAESLSQTAGKKLAVTNLPLSSRFSEVLKTL